LGELFVVQLFTGDKAGWTNEGGGMKDESV
jgi:hypothetical protein